MTGWDRKTFFMSTTFVLTLCLASLQTKALQISHVSAEPRVLNPEQKLATTLRFHLSDASSQVRVLFYDDRQLLVDERMLGALTAGEHELRWDAKTKMGESLPPEAYYYVIEATDKNKAFVRYDLTDSTGNEDLPATAIQWQTKEGKIHYHLSKPARVNVRIGLPNNGPLLKTLIDWVPRTSGSHTETWNGKDQSNVIDLKKHPNLIVIVDAYTLPQNTLIIGPPTNATKYIVLDEKTRHTRKVTQQQAKKMHFHAQQSAESRGDFAIQFDVLGEFPKNSEGVPIVHGKVNLRLDVGDEHLQRVLSRRFEPVFFLDGKFLMENEMGFIPMTFHWDSSQVNPGEHYLTANLRGYEGNFGMATVKVIVKKP